MMIEKDNSCEIEKTLIFIREFSIIIVNQMEDWKILHFGISRDCNWRVENNCE